MLRADPFTLTAFDAFIGAPEGVCQVPVIGEIDYLIRFADFANREYIKGKKSSSKGNFRFTTELLQDIQSLRSCRYNDLWGCSAFPAHAEPAALSTSQARTFLTMRRLPSGLTLRDGNENLDLLLRGYFLVTGVVTKRCVLVPCAFFI